jgi:hypothetical protein
LWKSGANFFLSDGSGVERPSPFYRMSGAQCLLPSPLTD